MLPLVGCAAITQRGWRILLAQPEGGLCPRARWGGTGPLGDPVTVPAGCSIFPAELQRPSRRWAQKRFVDIRYRNEPARSGHFPALEQPELLTDEVRSFLRLIREPTRADAASGAVRN